MLDDEPLVEPRPPAMLVFEGQIEEARRYPAPAPCGSATALPRDAAIAVEEIVVGNLLTGSDWAERDDVPRAAARDHVGARLAAGVDVALRHGHQHDAASSE